MNETDRRSRIARPSRQPGGTKPARRVHTPRASRRHRRHRGAHRPAAAGAAPRKDRVATDRRPLEPQDDRRHLRAVHRLVRRHPPLARPGYAVRVPPRRRAHDAHPRPVRDAVLLAGGHARVRALARALRGLGQPHRRARARPTLDGVQRVPDRGSLVLLLQLLPRQAGGLARHDIAAARRRGALHAPTRLHEVVFPSSKAFVFDIDRVYLQRPATIHDPRPLLARDLSASKRYDKDATEPVQNRLTTMSPVNYSDTRDGVRGLDW